MERIPEAICDSLYRMIANFVGVRDDRIQDKMIALRPFVRPPTAPHITAGFSHRNATAIKDCDDNDVWIENLGNVS